MFYSEAITQVIEKRFSCRNYSDEPIAREKQRLLKDIMSSSKTGPFGTRARFELIAATEQDRKALKGLGTYGFIKGATGFIVGAVEHSEKNLEDFGYLMECIVLYATDLGLGTCWLGGSFTKSNFAKKISASDDELLPAVSAVGYIANTKRFLDTVIRRQVSADMRHPWEKMFFVDEFNAPLSNMAAGAYSVPLEMLRLGPSASNKQPWRVVKSAKSWHFYLQRTRGYGKRTFGLLKMADLQRVDMGIAMCHFELAAKELGLAGEWEINEPGIPQPDDSTEYTATWRTSNRER